MTSIELKTGLQRARRRGVSHSALWGLVALGACRTNLPDEVFYDGTSHGGAPAVSAGGSSGTSTTTGGTSTIAGADATAGSEPRPSEGGKGENPGPGGTAEEPSNGGSSGAGATPNQPTFPDEPEIDCGVAPVSTEAFSRRALRAAAVDCALFHFCTFENATTSLEIRLQHHTADPRPESLERVQNAWRKAFEAWSTLEASQFGPLASRATSAGKDIYQGQGLRELIYAWPSTARCRVEDQVASQDFSNGWDGVLISGRGLYALEYLIFYPGSDTACSASSATGRAWATLDGAAVSRQKLAYASALAGDLVNRARGLTGAFSPNGGNFKQTFVDVVGYPSEQEAMNVLAWALLYIEREVKDWKLGVPAGYTLNNPVNEPESPYAGAGTEAIRANLRGFRNLFQGCGPNGEGLGFDDWLNEAGHADLGRAITSAWQNAQAVADGFGPLSSASQTDVQRLYAAVKVLTDLLKIDLLGTGSPLNLKLPGSIGDDTD